MAMLAAPRRKQKFSIDPRGSSWSKDETKFGQKMLEKMGWSKGRGLGANEDGRTEHVKISVKDDTRGVGCSKSQADSWIAHQDDFNSLLANLNQNYMSTEPEAVVKEAKVLSLEETSKSSKGRLHYQKFTKGKDLSSRKLEDLDCIFGRRKKKKVSKEKTCPVVEENPISPLESMDSPSQQYGVQTFQSKDSIRDYFTRKMAQLNSCKGTNMEVNEAGDEDNEMQGKELTQEQENEHLGLGLKTFSSSQSVQDYFAQKMAKLKNERMCSEMNGLDASIGAVKLVPEEADKEKKKEKKEKKHKKRKKESCHEELGEPVTKKKKKKIKSTADSEETVIESSFEISTIESEAQVKKKRTKDKKKDRKKNMREISSDTSIDALHTENQNEVSKENFLCIPQGLSAPIIGDKDTPSRKRVTFRDPVEAVLGETTPEASFEISTCEMTKAEHPDVTVETSETVLGIKPPQDHVNVVEHSEFNKQSSKKKSKKKAKKKAQQREVGEAVEVDCCIPSDENFTVSAMKDVCGNNTKSPEDTDITNAAKKKKKNNKKRGKRTPKEIEMQAKKRKHMLGCGEWKSVLTGFEGSNLDQIPGYSNCNLLLTAS